MTGIGDDFKFLTSLEVFLTNRDRRIYKSRTLVRTQSYEVKRDRNVFRELKPREVLNGHRAGARKDANTHPFPSEMPNRLNGAQLSQPLPGRQIPEGSRQILVLNDEYEAT